MSESNKIESIEGELQKGFDSFVGALASVLRKLESDLEHLSSSSDTRLDQFSEAVSDLKNSLSDFMQKSEEHVTKLTDDSGKMSKDLEGLKIAYFDKVVKEFENLYTQIDNINTQVGSISSSIEAVLSISSESIPIFVMIAVPNLIPLAADAPGPS